MITARSRPARPTCVKIATVTAKLTGIGCLIIVLSAACGGDPKPPQPSSPDVWALVNGREIRRDAVEKYYRTSVRPDARRS